jgi:hypothetical protein
LGVESWGLGVQGLGSGFGFGNSGFRVSSLEFGFEFVSDLGFEVFRFSGLGFGVLGLSFRVWGFGFRV